MASYLRPRRGRKKTAEEQNIILKRGEIFLEIPDTGYGSAIGKIKVGDGVTAYADLPYFMEQKLYNISEEAIAFSASTATTNAALLAQIATGSKLSVIIGAIKTLLTNINTSVTNINTSITQCDNAVFVGSSAPAKNTPYLLWVDTSDNNTLKFRTAVSNTNWTYVTSVWN